MPIFLFASLYAIDIFTPWYSNVSEIMISQAQEEI